MMKLSQRKAKKNLHKELQGASWLISDICEKRPYALRARRVNGEFQYLASWGGPASTRTYMDACVESLLDEKDYILALEDLREIITSLHNFRKELTSTIAVLGPDEEAVAFMSVEKYVEIYKENFDA